MTHDKTKTEKKTSRRVERQRKRELQGPDPIVRIGIMEEYDRIDFMMHGEFEAVDLEGTKFSGQLTPGKRWHVVPDETIEARAVYSILATAFARRDSADQLRRKLSKEDHPARVAEVGEEIYIDGSLITNNIKYRVLIGRWTTEREARGHLAEYQDMFAPRIVRQIIRPSGGTVRLWSEDFSESWSFENGIRLIPRTSDSQTTLFAVREGTGFHWEREVDRIYPGTIEVRLDHRALLMGITELPLELYLKGVVPSEMPASYPFEALKAQAIAARSVVLSKMGVKHLNDPFDLCGTVHCQAYTGNTNLHERASEAVEATRGQVIMIDRQVAEAVFSSCCGGHTEHKVNVWNPPDAAHLRGRLDSVAKKIAKTDDPPPLPDEVKLDEDFLKQLDLSREQDLGRWVGSRPRVWCNPLAHTDLPDILLNADKYFRWEISYSHLELEDIIRRKSGEDIGSLVNIIPIERGVSGRLMEIEIQGTKQHMRVKRELNIRRILSLNYLYSACFAINVDTSEDGRPINFHFRGAGWGHGVGMCQVGSGVMATKGHSYRTILKHYYTGTDVERVYGG